MPLGDLSEQERATVKRCLEFVLRSDALRGEFSARMGVEEHEVAALLDRWPDVHDSADDSIECIAINNAMNEVVNGLRITNREWRRWFQEDATVVRQIYVRWAETRGWTTIGVR